MLTIPLRTRTLQVNFFFPILAIIFTFPAFLALTIPFLFTVAIFELEELHFTFFRVPLTFNLTVFPTVTDADFLFKRTGAADAGIAIASVNNVTRNTVKILLLIFFMTLFLP